jgi:hypothetical protein
MDMFSFPVIISLTGPETYIAAQIGVMRNVAAHQRGLPRGNRSAEFNNAHQWETDVNGALAELAVAKAYGVYWNPSVNVGKAPDVGSLQVRSNTNKNGHLIIRESDKDDEIFVLVICQNPDFHVVGWIPANEAKVDKFFRPANQYGVAAWWVDQASLRMEALPLWAKAKDAPPKPEKT